MKLSYTLIASLYFLMECFVLTNESKAAFVQVPLTGFTADVVANGVGSPVSSTDSTFDAAGWYLLDSTYRYTIGGAAPLRALSPSGLIQSVVTPGLSFQLAPFTGANSLRIAVNNSAKTLNFAVPVSASQLFVLGATGSGQGTITITVNFTDATSQTFSSQSLPDWFAGTGFAIQGIGRVNPLNSQPTGSDALLNPRLYQKTLTLNAANYTKLISGISITQTSFTPGIVNIMAVSIATPPLGVLSNSSATFEANLFPNPVSSDFYLELKGTTKLINNQANCKIYNLIGEQVFAAVLAVSDDNRIYIQPTKQLAPGIYVLETVLNNKTSLHKFVVR